MQIHELPTISGSPSGGYFATDNGTQTTKIDYTALAQAIIEQYNASTLAGAAQSIQAAINAISPQVKTAITDLSTILPGEQGYFQLDSSVSPIGSTAYFTVWCTGNADRRGLIAVYTVASTTSVYMNAGHASSGTFAWRGWKEVSSKDDIAIADRLYLGPNDISIPADSDFNDYKTAGTFVVNAGSQMATMANVPVSDIGGRLDVRYILKTNAADADSAKRLFQIFTGNNSNYPQWVRFYNGSTWFPWQKLPTRAEVDALSAVTTGTFTVDAGLENGANHLSIKQNGKVVTVNGYVSGTIAASTNVNLGTVSGVSMPSEPVRTRGGCGSNAYTTGADAYVSMTTAGKIVCYAAAAATNVYFSFSYVAS